MEVSSCFHRLLDFLTEIIENYLHVMLFVYICSNWAARKAKRSSLPAHRNSYRLAHMKDKRRLDWLLHDPT